MSKYLKDPRNRNSDPLVIQAAGLDVQIEAFRRRDLWGVVEPFRPVIDEVHLVGQPLKLFMEGRWNKDKEFMLGTTEDELAWAVVGFRNFPLRWNLFEVGV